MWQDQDHAAKEEAKRRAAEWVGSQAPLEDLAATGLEMRSNLFKFLNLTDPSVSYIIPNAVGYIHSAGIVVSTVISHLSVQSTG